MGQRLWNFWYVAVSAAVIGWMWISLSLQVAEAVAGAIPAGPALRGLLVSVSLLVLAMVAWVVSFCGPTRASVGELTWYPRRNRAAGQRVQVGAVALILLAVLECMIVAIALQGGTPAAAASLLVAATLGGAVAILAAGAWLQTKDLSRVGEAVAAFLLVVSLAVLASTAFGVPVLAAAPVGVAAALPILLRLLRAPRSGIRPRLQGTPAWELTRADANVSAAQLALADLDYGHLSGVVDARSLGSARRPLALLRPNGRSLFGAVLLRTLAERWYWLVALPVLSVSLGAIGGVRLGLFVAVASAVLLAVQNGAVWTEWTSSPALSRTFAATSRAPGAAVFAALCVAPTGVAVLGGAALSGIATAECGVLALLVTAYTMLARALSAANNRSSGPMGTILFLPDLGYLPLGIIGRVLSGWLISLAAVGVGVAYGMHVGIGVMAVLLCVSAARTLSGRRRLPSRQSARGAR